MSVFTDPYQDSYPPSLWGGGTSPGEPVDVAITLGLTGPGGSAEVGGGEDNGVRIVPSRGGTPVDLADVAKVDWGDGTVREPPDISGGFIAHVYTAEATDVVITVTLDDGGAGTSDTFDVVDTT